MPRAVLQWQRNKIHEEVSSLFTPNGPSEIVFLCPYRFDNDECEHFFDEGHRDHVIPRSRGGSDESYNRQRICATCNLQKGARTPEEFIDWLRWKRARNEAMRLMARPQPAPAPLPALSPSLQLFINMMMTPNFGSPQASAQTPFDQPPTDFGPLAQALMQLSLPANPQSIQQHMFNNAPFQGYQSRPPVGLPPLQPGANWPPAPSPYF